MATLGGVVQQIGFVLAVVGLVAYAGTTLLRLLWLVRWRKMFAPTVIVGFYARAVGTFGLMTMLTGGVMKGAFPWPVLIVVFVFGAPALALLLVRPVTTAHPPFDVAERDKP